MAGERLRAIRSLNRALKNYDRGDLSGALESLDQGIDMLRRCPPGRQSGVDLAKAFQLGGQIRLENGDLEDGLEWMARAEDLFSEHDGSGQDYGRCLHDMAMVFHSINLNSAALDYAKKAYVILQRFGEPYTTDLPRMIRRLSMPDEQRDEWDEETFALLVRQWQDTRKPDLRAKAAQDVASFILDAAKPGEHLTVAHAALKEAFEYTWRARDLENSLSVLKTFVDMRWVGHRLPEWARAASDAVRTLARTSGTLQQRAEASTVMAAVLSSEGNPGDALSEALAATALNDVATMNTRSAALRSLTTLTGCAPRELALDLAIQLNDPALAIELIESARFQVLPSAEGKGRRLGTSAPNSLAGGFIGFSETGLTRPRPISVRGDSRLARFYPPDWNASPIAIEEAISAIGGHGAQWWGIWAVNGRIYWATAIHDQMHCGVISITGNHALESLLTKAFGQSLLDAEASVRTVLTGDWCRSSQSEADLSAALGDALVPDPLKNSLAEATLDQPISLVVAGNLFGMLPLPLLAAGRSAGFADRPRLIELAVIRVAAPAVLIERVARHPVFMADLRPITVACVDANSNLDNAGRIPSGAQMVLAGRRHEGAAAATKQNLLGVLRGSAPSSPGVFYFSGHGSHDGAGGDVSDGLSLMDGAITAQEIFNFDDSGKPTAPFPERALLSACELAGSRGAGAGEWFGLTAAILWAGARQVISTHWSIWDTPFTADFDMELAHLLRKSSDPARSLRALQLEYLNSWRLSLHDLDGLAVDGIPYRYERTPFPMIWAAYCCTGVSG